jgi:hypothetical protein
MAWHGPYYYQSRRIDGRVVREYIGAGYVAGLISQLDALEREKRHLKKVDLHLQKTALEVLDNDMKALAQMTGLVARAALLAAGYHQHKRQWRKRRECVHTRKASRAEVPA